MSSDAAAPAPARAIGDGGLAIRARGVGKHYVLGRRQGQETLREALVSRLSDPLGRRGREEFWALEHVDLDVHRGEVVGLIGRNGAGKSTLLKILSRITAPTVGTVDIWGRVGSLLEVGTGFHPELTGRENIFLNGSILGMSRREIAARFDEIVDFSGVEKFIDTPVKRYSSGMFVRLAFAVAAHLEPEILIVDEVLAVGDAEFQRKCLGKMQAVAGHGRTVIFVSHNLGTVQQFCTRGVFLAGGQVVADGPIGEVVRQYLQALGNVDGTSPIARGGDGSVRATAVRLLDVAGEPATVLLGGQELAVEIDYDNPGRRRRAEVVLNVYNDRGVLVSGLNSPLTGAELPLADRGTLRCRIPRLPLTLGNYRLALAIHGDREEADVLTAAATFDVASSVFFPTGRALGAGTAAVLIDHQWESVPAGPGRATLPAPA